MKHFKNIQLIAIAIASLYLLQACGGGNYNAYIEAYKDIAISEMERTGYPASIILAQAILESEGGRSTLAAEFNNHFNITCSKSWKGKKHYEEEEDFTSGEIVEVCYQVYSNPYSSFMEHTDILRDDRHYRSLFRLDPRDYVSWAQELTALGYANNDTYGKTLISIIEKNGLQEYDDRASSKTRPPKGTASRIEDGAAAIRDYDYVDAKKRTKDRIDNTRDRIKDSYNDRISDLEADISDHNNKYRDTRRNSRSNTSYDGVYEEDDYPYRSNQSSSDYQYGDKDDYNDNRRYREQDQYVGNKYDRARDNYGYDELEEAASKRRYDSDTYSSKYDDEYDYKDKRSTNSDRQRSSSYTFDDSKYDGYQKNTRPSRSSSYDYQEASRPSRASNYDTPSRYDNTARRRQAMDDNWLKDSEQETSISDFTLPEDYAYINNLKVTTARYDDTPLTIAARFNVSVKDILKYNEQIKTNNQLLKENEKVYLQAKKKNYENGKSYHVVQYGERMFDIAQMYGLSLNALYDKNKMPRGSEPAIGEKIKLSRGKIKRQPELRSNYRDSYHSPSPLTPPSRVPIETQPVKVVTTPITNNFPNQAAANQQIPTTTVLLQPVTTNVMYHTVEKGETLYRIAHQYGSTVESIKRMNNLRGNTLSRGMRLKVR